jgi:hypothetical protein
VSYLCDHCHLRIAVTTSDPVVMLKRGTFHYECMRVSAREENEAQEDKLRLRREKRERERYRMELDEARRQLGDGQ